MISFPPRPGILCGRPVSAVFFCRRRGPPRGYVGLRPGRNRLAGYSKSTNIVLNVSLITPPVSVARNRTG